MNIRSVVGLWRARARCWSVALCGPGPAAIGQGRGGHVHRRRQQVGPRPARQRPGLGDPARRGDRVEFSARKAPAAAPAAAAARPDSEAETGRRAKAGDRAGRHDGERPPDAGDRRRCIPGRSDVQGDRGRSGDARRVDRDSARRVGRPAGRPGPAVRHDEGQRQDLVEAELHRVRRKGLPGRHRVRRDKGQG